MNHLSLEAMSHLQEAAPDRFILVGSVGRAAVLGDDVSTLTSFNPNRFHDVDLLDTTAELSVKYTLDNGGIVDFGLTQTIHPTTCSRDTWGLYDPRPHADSIDPLVTFPARALGIHTTAVVNAENTIHMATPDSCAQLMMADVSIAFTGRLSKHHAQIRRLRQLSDDCPTDHTEMVEAVKDYNAQVDGLMRADSSRYMLARRFIFTHVGPVARMISEGPVGGAIRGVRNSTRQPVAVSSISSLLNQPIQTPETMPLADS